mgnify:CR=1 FL=1
MVVVGELCADTSVLVDLSGLADNGSGVLVDLLADSLVLADDLGADRLVERVEEVEESGRDALLFCPISCVVMIRQHRRHTYGQDR